MEDDSKRFAGVDVSIAGLSFKHAIPGGKLKGFSFYRCHLYGPAVLMPGGGSMFERVQLPDFPPDSLFWYPPEQTQSLIGVILVEDCLFEECSFTAISFVSTPEEIADFRKRLGY